MTFDYSLAALVTAGRPLSVYALLFGTVLRPRHDTRSPCSV